MSVCESNHYSRLANSSYKKAGVRNSTPENQNNDSVNILLPFISQRVWGDLEEEELVLHLSLNFPRI